MNLNTKQTCEILLCIKKTLTFQSENMERRLVLLQSGPQLNASLLSKLDTQLANVLQEYFLGILISLIPVAVTCYVALCVAYVAWFVDSVLIFPWGTSSIFWTWDSFDVGAHRGHTLFDSIKNTQQGNVYITGMVKHKLQTVSRKLNVNGSVREVPAPTTMDWCNFQSCNHQHSPLISTGDNIITVKRDQHIHTLFCTAGMNWFKIVYNHTSLFCTAAINWFK